MQPARSIEATSSQRGAPAAQPDRLKQIFGAYPSGVTIVTSVDGFGLPVGMTVSAVMSLSLDPPQLLVSLQAGKYTLEALRDCGYFAVNFLREDQALVSGLFASNRYDKFRGTKWHAGYATGTPCLDGVLAYAECAVAEILVSGDHEIVIGTVVGGRASDGRPLVYHNRGYHRLATNDQER